MQDGRAWPWWAISRFEGGMILMALGVLGLLVSVGVRHYGLSLVSVVMLAIIGIVVPAVIVVMVMSRRWVTRYGVKGLVHR
ncbi:hypothetical protein E6C70_09285 [Glaciibacter flavus]|uniref:Uncharacterized protein n=1 Tax=Orlajensenia flava TaxID=2565934 RepID=A0A4V6RZ48_9MICO|nr:hypothetical protein [Glaciibacter flavus]THG34447.1 hypothetical protein E6C70_09285 [Glaciibacter flavus]